MSLLEGARALDIQVLGFTLVHFLWQGVLAAGLLAIADVVARPRSPRVRYAMASGTLLVMAALPVVTFVAIRDGLRREPAAVAVGPTGLEWPGVGDAASAPTGEERAPAGLLPVFADTPARERLAPLLPGVVLAWSIGVALLSIRSLGGWLVAQELKRSGLAGVPAPLQRAFERLRERIGVSRAARLLQSARVEVPTVVGWLRPVVLIPASALTGLTPGQVELILAHELAHVRRFDYLANLLQTVAETLLFYHPAVWWVSHRMRVEREHCCDDAAVMACGDAVSYARALTRLEDLRARVPAAAVAATGGSLLDRVTRLLGDRPGPLPGASRWLAGLTTFGLLAAALWSGPPLKGEAHAAVAPSEWSTATGDGPPSAAPVADAVSAGPTVVAQAATSTRQASPTAAKEEPADERRPDLPVEKILELMRAGVTPEYIDGMAEAGHPSLSWSELQDLRSHGVGPDYVKALAAEGYEGLTPSRLIWLRSHGVSAEFARGLKAAGLEGLSASDLVELRSQGVGPEFAAAFRKAGYGDLTVTRLISLRSQGVTPEYASELAALGLEELTPSRLIALRSQGVSTDYVRGLKELGYGELSVPALIGLRSQGVSTEYVRQLRALGHSGLSVAQLIDLRSHGVSPEFVRELKEAGFGDLSPAELVELRSNGVRPELLRRLKGVQEKGGSR